MNKKIWLVAIFAGVCSCCIIPYAMTMLPQDIKLSEHKNAFSKAQHPTSTKFITAYKFLGIRDFTRTMYPDTFRQGCDYEVGEIREYWDTQENIKAFYANNSVVIDGSKKPMVVAFISLDSNGLIDTNGAFEQLGGPETYLLTLHDKQIFGLFKLNSSALYYYVSIRGFSPSNFDFGFQ